MSSAMRRLVGSALKNASSSSFKTNVMPRRFYSSGGSPPRKVVVLGAAGGIGQPLALLMKLNPLVSKLALYDIAGTPGVAADVGHINSRAEESPIKWASRWDTYFLMTDDQIHWFSIINSLMIVFFLSGMVAMIIMKTLDRDISNYNQLERQETGWILVHGDVFSPPRTGVQFFRMTLVTMIFAMLGFLSPSNRGGLMTTMVLLWVFMGLFASYSSARLYMDILPSYLTIKKLDGN